MERFLWLRPRHNLQLKTVAVNRRPVKTLFDYLRSHSESSSKESTSAVRFRCEVKATNVDASVTVGMRPVSVKKQRRTHS